jgi:hypothetical protein
MRLPSYRVWERKKREDALARVACRLIYNRIPLRTLSVLCVLCGLRPGLFWTAVTILHTS